MDYSILIAGQAGTGLASVENQLIGLLAKNKYYYFATKRYMSRIRGGSNRHMIRVAETQVHALAGIPWDILVAFDGEGEIYRDELSRDGIYISQNDVAAIRSRAATVFNDKKASNAVLAGFIAAIVDIPVVGKEYLFGKELAVEMGLAAKKALIPKALHDFKIYGNQALGLGALAGGCQFMAGYPMTPATSVMDYIAHAAEKIPVHFEQAEDEISAINMAIGASYAGLRAMTASSGGGFALMQEGVSLAGMTETPIVIVDSQRPGPATGMPTRTEQADLDFVLHSGHGEFARVIYAPGDCDDCFILGKHAFTMADKYRLPVFILTDQYLADSYMVMTDVPEAHIDRRSSWQIVRADSDEHDTQGFITEDPVLRTRNQDQRVRKMYDIQQDIILPTVEWAGDTIVVCWGSTKHIVREAVSRLNALGHAVQFLHCSQVFPVSKMIQNMCAYKKVIVVEQNSTGQFAKLLKTTLSIESISVLKYDGDCFTVKELEGKLNDVL